MKKSEPTLSFSKWESIAKECMQLGSIHFNLQGGETLLLGEDLISFLRVLYPWKNSISITTNGTINDRRFLNNLYQEGVDLINVSLDSSNKSEHDLQRGRKGNFDEVLETLRISKEIGFSVSISTVVTKETVKSRGLVNLLSIARHYGASLHPNFVVPQGRYHGQFAQLLDEDEVSWMRNFIGENPDVSRDLDYNYRYCGCPAVNESVYITCYGEVLPCPFIQVTLGDAKDEPLRKIIMRGLQVPYFNGYPSGCLASENRSFIEQYMKKICNSETVPAPFNAIFR